MTLDLITQFAEFLTYGAFVGILFGLILALFRKKI